MMRHASAMGIGLGLFITLPALGGVQDAATLQSALDETVRALAVLTGIEQDFAAGKRELAVPVALASSEAPLADARTRDEQQERLRKEVGRLQAAHDELANRSSGSAGAALAPEAVAQRNSASDVAVITAISTGMTDELRAQFSSEPLLPSVASTGTGTTAGSGKPTGSAPAAGTTERIADELRRGQALYRSGKYKEALIALRAIEHDVRARYWLARTLEKLERLDEALALYQAVAADANAGYLAERARNDAEFLEWRRTFQAKLAKEEASKRAAQAGPRQGQPADASAPVKLAPQKAKP